MAIRIDYTPHGAVGQLAAAGGRARQASQEQAYQKQREGQLLSIAASQTAQNKELAFRQQGQDLAQEQFTQQQLVQQQTINLQRDQFAAEQQMAADRTQQAATAQAQSYRLQLDQLEMQRTELKRQAEYRSTALQQAAQTQRDQERNLPYMNKAERETFQFAGTPQGRAVLVERKQAEVQGIWDQGVESRDPTAQLYGNMAIAAGSVPRAPSGTSKMSIEDSLKFYNEVQKMNLPQDQKDVLLSSAGVFKPKTAKEQKPFSATALRGVRKTLDDYVPLPTFRGYGSGKAYNEFDLMSAYSNFATAHGYSELTQPQQAQLDDMWDQKMVVMNQAKGSLLLPDQYDWDPVNSRSIQNLRAEFQGTNPLDIAYDNYRRSIGTGVSAMTRKEFSDFARYGKIRRYAPSEDLKTTPSIPKRSVDVITTPVLENAINRALEGRRSQ